MHLAPRPGAPIACDMTTARDTPDERIAEYGELFEQALLRRERRADAVVFAFAPGVREQVEDLAHREHACCPFLDYRVETVGAEVVWTISGERAAVATTLDAFYALAGGDGDRGTLAAGWPSSWHS